MLFQLDDIKKEWELHDTNTVSFDEYFKRWYVAVYNTDLNFVGFQRRNDGVVRTIHV